MAAPRRNEENDLQGAMEGNDEQEKEKTAKDEAEDPEEENGNQQQKRQDDEQPLERIEKLLDGLYGRVNTVTKDVDDLRVRINYCTDVLDEMASILKRMDSTNKQGNSRSSKEEDENPLKLQMLAAAAAEQAKTGPSKAPNEQPSTECIFCSGTHWATECPTYKTLTAKRRRIFEKNKCERCLSMANHLVTSCITQSTCFYCRRANPTAEMSKHHSAFCVHTFEM
ncbi:hypothetical protein Aduo_018122 [Ancylostoma duodenale]